MAIALPLSSRQLRRKARKTPSRSPGRGSQVGHGTFSTLNRLTYRSFPLPRLAPLIPLALLLTATPVLAQDDAAPSASGAGGLSGDWLIAGAGATVFPQYEGSKNYEILPSPGAVGSLGGVSFQILGSTASASIGPRISKQWRLSLGPTFNYGTNRTHLSVITDTRVRALGRVKPAIELGGSVGLTGNGVITSDFDRLSISVSYRHDVNGAHGGNLLKPAVLYLMPVSRKAMLLFLAQADRADSKYARTYFGITPAQSTASTLPTFAARGGWKDWLLAAAGSVSLSGDLTHGLQLVGGASYTKLLNDFAASPVTSIAGSRGQWTGAVGLAYSF